VGSLGNRDGDVVGGKGCHVSFVTEMVMPWAGLSIGDKDVMSLRQLFVTEVGSCVGDKDVMSCRIC
jgi:hypothetical protein